MKAFISYSTVQDQIIALRLQTMAAVYGMIVYVPPATTRQDATLSPEVQSQLTTSDLVLSVITHQPDASAVNEMNLALQQRKLLIPIVSPSVPPQYYAGFQPCFVVNSADPSTTEQQIVQFLAAKQQEERGKKAILALAMLATALLLFGSD